MSDIETKIFWEEHVEEWSNSGLSQAEYCRQKNLNPNIFSKWKNRVTPIKVETPDNFIELQLPEKVQESGIELVVRNIFKIKLKSDFDRRLLKDILQIIGELQFIGDIL